MAFTFGLGSDTMLNQFQRDATQFKLIDMSGNIQKQSIQSILSGGGGGAAAYVDYTFSHLNRFMQQDQENDNSATFLLEYQALLRARIQQMITELTSALTRDLDRSLTDVRAVWNTTAGRPPRQAAQGYTTDIEDAGAARVAYNFASGFAHSGTILPAGGALNAVPYTGRPTVDSIGTSNKVSPDTPADARFGSAANNAVLRVAGTAVIQQSFPEDGSTVAVIDELVVNHQSQSVRYGEIGGGFVAHKNNYKFTDIDPASTVGTNGRYNMSNAAGGTNAMYFTNTTDASNQNDSTWKTIAPNAAVDGYLNFNRLGNVKNEFERVLYDTIFELDQRNLLRDIFRLSEKNGFFTDIQIASTSSLTTGSQIQASVKLNFVPALATRHDLGGRIQVIMDRFTAFFHS